MNWYIHGCVKVNKFSNEQTQRSFKQTCKSFAVEPIWLPPDPLKVDVKDEMFISGSVTMGSSSNYYSGCLGGVTRLAPDNKIAYEFPCIRGLKIQEETKVSKSNRHDYILEFCKYTAVVSAVCKKCGKIELPMIRKCVINPV